MTAERHGDESRADALRDVSTAGASAYIVQQIDRRHHRLYWSLGGVSQISARGRRFDVRPPMGILVPAGCPHRLGGDRRLAVARFSSRRSPEPWAELRRLVLDDLVVSLLRRLRRSDGGSIGSVGTTLLVDEIGRALRGDDLAVPIPTDARARIIADALIDDPGDSRELRAWAREIGAGERHLHRLFSTETGMNFRTWRRRVRMGRAQSLLVQGVPVGDVARLVGYRSPEAFMRAFREHTGTTPSAYAANGLTDPPSDLSGPFAQAFRLLEADNDLKALLTIAVERYEQGGDMTRPSARTALAAAALLLVAACGDDDTDDSDAATVTATDGATSTSSATDSGSETTADVPAAGDGSAAEDGDSAGQDVDASAAYPRTVEHALGSVVIEQKPERPYAFRNQAAFDALLAVGTDPYMYGTFEGRTLLTYQVEELESEPIGLDVGDGVNLELLAAEGVDVVVAPAFAAEDIASEQLDQIAPVVYLPDETLDDVPEQIRILSEVFDLDDDAATDALAAFDGTFDVELDDIPSSVSAITLRGSLAMYAPGSAFSVALQRLGFPPLGFGGLADAPPTSTDDLDVSEELLADIDSELLIGLPVQRADEAFTELESGPVFQAIPAVVDGRYVKLSPDASRAASNGSVLSIPFAVNELIEVLADLG
ncbi:MAG: helix-turn-helix domain-containing protein [Actinomycetota bacterium]